MRYIAASAGVTAVLVNLFMVICDLDDGVLVPTPYDNLNILLIILLISLFFYLVVMDHF